MDYSLSHNDGAIRALDLDNVLSEVSKVLIRPLKESLQNKRNLDSMERSRQDEVAEPLPRYTNYWLSQTDPNYVDQEETDTAFTRRRKRSTSRNPAEAVFEYLKSQPAVNQNDLREAIQGFLPNCIAPERATFGGPLSVEGTETSFSASGVDRGLVQSMAASSGPWMNIEQADGIEFISALTGNPEGIVGNSCADLQKKKRNNKKRKKKNKKKKEQLLGQGPTTTSTSICD